MDQDSSSLESRNIDLSPTPSSVEKGKKKVASEDHLTQKARVNFRVDLGGAKADYSKPAAAPPNTPCNLLHLLPAPSESTGRRPYIHPGLLQTCGDPGREPRSTDCHPTTEYTHPELESARNHLERFVQHCCEYHI